jgi:hypothetical protein
LANVFSGLWGKWQEPAFLRPARQLDSLTA